MVGKQQFRHIIAVLKRRRVQGHPAVIPAGIGRPPAFPRLLATLYMLPSAMTSSICCFQHDVRRYVNQQLCHASATLKSDPAQWRKAFVIYGVDFGLVGDQQLHHLFASVPRCTVQYRLVVSFILVENEFRIAFKQRSIEQPLESVPSASPSILDIGQRCRNPAHSRECMRLLKTTMESCQEAQCMPRLTTVRTPPSFLSNRVLRDFCVRFNRFYLPHFGPHNGLQIWLDFIWP